MRRFRLVVGLAQRLAQPNLARLEHSLNQLDWSGLLQRRLALEFGLADQQWWFVMVRLVECLGSTRY